MKKGGTILLIIFAIYILGGGLLMYYQHQNGDKSLFGLSYNPEREKAGMPLIEDNWDMSENTEVYPDSAGLDWRNVTWKVESNIFDVDKYGEEGVWLKIKDSGKGIHFQKIDEIKDGKILYENDTYRFAEDSLRYELILTRNFEKNVSPWNATLNINNKQAEDAYYANPVKEDTTVVKDDDELYDEEEKYNKWFYYNENTLAQVDSVLKAWKLTRIKKR
jgi:hypothetical protein